MPTGDFLTNLPPESASRTSSYTNIRSLISNHNEGFEGLSALGSHAKEIGKNFIGNLKTCILPIDNEEARESRIRVFDNFFLSLLKEKIERKKGGKIPFIPFEGNFSDYIVALYGDEIRLDCQNYALAGWLLKELATYFSRNINLINLILEDKELTVELFKEINNIYAPAYIQYSKTRPRELSGYLPKLVNEFMPAFLSELILITAKDQSHETAIYILKNAQVIQAMTAKSLTTIASNNLSLGDFILLDPVLKSKLDTKALLSLAKHNRLACMIMADKSLAEKLPLSAKMPLNALSRIFGAVFGILFYAILSPLIIPIVSGLDLTVRLKKTRKASIEDENLLPTLGVTGISLLFFPITLLASMAFGAYAGWKYGVFATINPKHWLYKEPINVYEAAQTFKKDDPSTANQIKELNRNISRSPISNQEEVLQGYKPLYSSIGVSNPGVSDIGTGDRKFIRQTAGQ